MASNKNFYVYALLDPRKPGPFRYGRWKFEYEPFYIGKGTGSRHLAHTRRISPKNLPKDNKIRKILAYGFALRNRPENGRMVLISGDTDRAINPPCASSDIAAIFHDVGWEGLPDGPDRVHPYEHEVRAAFPITHLIGVHNTRTDATPLFERASDSSVYDINLEVV